jgi:hypothetical protein
MPSNKIILECISLLASAIHHVNMNARSRHIAAQVEGLVRGALIEDVAHEIKQWREIASSLKELGDLFANTASATGNANPPPTGALLSKSILEDEMKRRGVLADNTLDANKFSEADRSHDAAKETLATFDALAAIVTAAAEKRFAADPFAPTFELFAGEDAVTVKLYPRPGSVQYIVNVTGPRSSAVRMEGALPSRILVSQVVESPL